jgi:hypothetical protein
MASITATVSYIPAGLGVFEGSLLALLGVLGVPVEGGLTTTLLMRGFTFWLPIAPGLLIVRRETARSDMPLHATGGRGGGSTNGAEVDFQLGQLGWHLGLSYAGTADS